MTTAVTGEHHASVQRIQLRISGMSCSACAHRVESTLNKLPGVRAAVNFGTRVATIDTRGEPLAAGDRRLEIELRPNGWR